MATNYRLKEGSLAAGRPTEAQLFGAVEAVLASQKRSTYQFALLQSLVNLSAEHQRTEFSFDEVFEEFAGLYWRLLSRYPLRQIHRHGLYTQSAAEKIILSYIREDPSGRGLSLADLPDQARARICDAIRQACSKSVLGAAYGNSEGRLFGFSKITGQVVLTPDSRAFFAANSRRISERIEWAWLSMTRQLTPDAFPPALEARLQAIAETAAKPLTEEESAMGPQISGQQRPEPGDLRSIQQYVASTQEILRREHSQLAEIASQIEAELEHVLKDDRSKRLMVQSRVKDADSLAEKIYRKNYYNRYPDREEFIQNLPDLIGARILCLLNHQEEDVFRRLQAAYSSTLELNGTTYSYRPEDSRLLLDLSGQPQRQKNGQPIYRISCKWKKSPSEYVNCELQIKSMVHFFWGELDHMLFYKNYSYLISQSFYSQYMLKVEHALSNIDEQLVLLSQQIAKDGARSSREIRDIASLVLYRHYHEDMEQQLGCPIDLREVFDLLVDMHFRNYGNQDANIQKLSTLIQDISTHAFQRELLPRIMSGRLSPAAFSHMQLQLAQIIDAAVRRMDVYWILFLMAYGSHFWDESHEEENLDYNLLLGKICTVLIRMIQSGFADSVEQIYEELDDLYEQFKQAIVRGILLCFGQEPKLDFFIFSAKLRQVNELSEEIARQLQVRLTVERAQECCSNLETVALFTQCKLSAALYHRVPYDALAQLMNRLKEEDPFALDPDLSQFDGEPGRQADYTEHEFNILFARGGA